MCFYEQFYCWKILLFCLNIGCYITKVNFVKTKVTEYLLVFCHVLFFFLVYLPYLFLWNHPKCVKYNIQSINICVSVFPSMVIMLMKLGNDLCNFLHAHKVEVCLQIVLMVFLLPFSCSTCLFQWSFLLLKNCLLMKLLNYA